jgi:pyruvate/2-oxoglutarate dehydrogenase complex dihydrolipoamide acyltransferase (E2) component
MAQAFILPDLREGIHEAEIQEVLVKEGARVEEGDAILVIETDKAMVEVPSPYAGTIAKIHVVAGEVVQVRDVLISLALTVFVMKAAVTALKTYPRFNASIDVEAEEIILKQYYHLNIAVDTERGFIVPVIRDVDRKSIAELAVEMPDIAQRARNGETQLGEMQGGTFTISNLWSPAGTVAYSCCARLRL